MNQKTKEIAIFDGYIVAGKWVQLDTPNYLTDLNALHRVALDVMDKVTGLHYDLIQAALLSRPINGEYTDLHDAIYDAIVYLKNNQPCQPK